MAFRRHTLLPLDDCLYTLQPSVPHLTRSALDLCLPRHGISRLPDIESDKPKWQLFKPYPIEFSHIDIAEVQTAAGKLYLSVAIDRTNKFAFASLVARATGAAARLFLDELVAVVPYRIHTILTDNGIQFADLPKNRSGPTARWRGHPFDRTCQSHGIEHRLTKPNHPWTNPGRTDEPDHQGSNREAISPQQPRPPHLADFLAAYNFARRLKTLGGLTSYEYISKVWTSEQERFILDPIHQMPGMNN